MIEVNRRWQVVLPALAVLLVFAGCRAPEPADPAPAPTPEVTSTPDARSASPDVQAAPSPAAQPITLAFAGDIHFEGGVSELLAERNADVGPLSEALAGADLAVANLETALTSRGSRTSKELEDPAHRYWFAAPPAALDVLERSGVDVVSMANNHGADYGATGLRESLKAAERGPVRIIGIGNDAAQAFRPYEKVIKGTRVAVLAADASTLESRGSIWNIGSRGPGLARAGARLVNAVREASRSNEVVAVYLHWGEENVGCPPASQRRLAQDLADAGADVVVGAHAHVLLGAGMLGDTYVSYGLGNFLWYHGIQSATGVLQVQLSGGKVVRDTWIPGEIPPAGGQPRALRGSAAAEATRDWRSLRGCTDLAAPPRANASTARPSSRSTAPPSTSLPAYAAAVEPVPAELRRRMTGLSHDPDRCPVALADLRLLTLTHVDFAGAPQSGQLIMHRQHADDVVEVFRRLYEQRFPIRHLRLVDEYGGDDDRSMAADNSSGYNCRTVAGQQNLSAHAYGAAIDINPVENPYLVGGTVQPPAGEAFADVDRRAGDNAAPGVITDRDVVVRAFDAIGWTWGGTWNSPDYQHFQAP